MFKFSWASLMLASSAMAVATEPVERISVYASHTPMQESEVLASVTVLELADIQARQARDLPALLAQLPGVQLSRDGGRGQNSGLYLRGGNTGHTLVLIDGIRAGAATNGYKSLALVPLELVERIEVIRGPRAAWYGADALAGVIAITTRQSVGAELNANLGSYGQAGADLSTGWQQDRLQLNASLGYSRADGFNVREDLDPDRDGYQQRFAKFAASYQTSFGTLQAQADINSGNTEFDTSWGTEDQSAVLQRSYRLGWQHDGARWQQQAQLSRIYDQDTSYGPASRSPFITERDEFSYQSSVALTEQLQWHSGVNWYSEQVDRSAVPYLEQSRINRALFSGLNWQQAGWLLEGSARRDLNQRYGGNNTWQVAAGYQFADGWLVRASRGAAFKAPTFNDLYYPGSANPELAPERAIADELALSYYTDNGSVQLAWFAREVSDLIQFNLASYLPENISQARITGAELQVDVTLAQLRQQFAYTFLDTENQLTSEPLPRRPKHNLNWRLEYQWRQLSTYLSASYQSESFQGPYASRSYLGGYTLWGLGAAYPLSSKLTVRANIDNLLDKNYQSSDGYNTAGLTFGLNLNYRAF